MCNLNYIKALKLYNLKNLSKVYKKKSWDFFCYCKFYYFLVSSNLKFIIIHLLSELSFFWTESIFPVYFKKMIQVNAIQWTIRKIFCNCFYLSICNELQQVPFVPLSLIEIKLNIFCKQIRGGIIGHYSNMIFSQYILIQKSNVHN